MVLATGIVSTVAGNGKLQGGDGPALQEGFDPDDIAVDSAGEISFIADFLNNRIRRFPRSPMG